LVAFFLATTADGQEETPSLEKRFDKTVIDYVNSVLLKQYDANADGFLDKTEWANAKWTPSNPPENSDLDQDRKLSREELCIRISKSRGIAIKGESALPLYPAEMLEVLRPGVCVRLHKESGRYDVTVLSAKDVDTQKEKDKTYTSMTVKRVNNSYLVLKSVVLGREYEVLVSANAISSIAVPVDEKPIKDAP